MTDLHEALNCLSPVDWADIPQNELSEYLTTCFNAGELLCNSVPPPPNGTPFESAEPQYSTPNAAKSAKEVHSSSARPSPPHQDHTDLQKNWGKPMKFSQKDNPLNIGLYKMAGHDRHGAWFARHNVIEGLGFAKFKKAMQREFPETLLTHGPPGAGAKRGLSAERRVDRIDVPGVGRMEVYQLSAQMPSPVSPRDFLTLLLTTDQGLSDKSAAEVPSGRHDPRHFMVVSRPLDHPDAPPRSSFVRGQYESVEMIREIPLHASITKSKSTLELSSSEQADSHSGSDESNDPELNPVEWIMVTRSDPAGGIPRFLVDRGTPDAMLGDVVKFLDWACPLDEIPDPDEDVDKQLETSEQVADEVRRESAGEVSLPNGDDAVEKPEILVREATPQTPAQSQSPAPDQGGLLSNLVSALETATATYAPETVSSFVHNQLHPHESPGKDYSDYESDSSSTDSFMSASELRRLSTAPEHPEPESTENLSVVSGASSGQSSKVEKKDLSRHEKEILKITREREKLDQKLAKKREAEEAKYQQSQEKDQTGESKAREKMEKEMNKTEERHRKEIEKLEARREKEAKKAEEKRKKREDQNKLSLVARERDELRSQADLLRRENGLLADQVETLQRENTALANKIGKLGGPDALRVVQDEVKKAGSVKSSGSRTSLESLDVSQKG